MLKKLFYILLILSLIYSVGLSFSANITTINPNISGNSESDAMIAFNITNRLSIPIYMDYYGSNRAISPKQTMNFIVPSINTYGSRLYIYDNIGHPISFFKNENEDYPLKTVEVFKSGTWAMIMRTYHNDADGMACFTWEDIK
jgi:hypothetical protein